MIVANEWKSTNSQTHPIGVAPTPIPDGHYFWMQLTGHFDADDRRVFPELLSGIWRTYLDKDLAHDECDLSLGQGRNILIILPHDDTSRVYYDGDSRIIFIRTSDKKAVAFPSSCDRWSLHDMSLITEIRIPRARHCDGFILVLDDGMKLHIWYDFRQANRQLWPARNSVVSARAEGLFGRQFFLVFDTVPDLRKKLADNGWYPLSMMVPSPFLELSLFYEEGKFSEGDQYIAEQVSADFLRGELAKWRGNRILSQRQHLLREVIDLYEVGKFAGCETLAIAQFNGLIADKLGVDQAVDRKIAKSVDNISSSGSKSAIELAKPHFISFVRTVFEGKGGQVGARMPHSRKAVQHGNKTDFSQRDALQSVLLMMHLCETIGTSGWTDNLSGTSIRGLVFPEDVCISDSGNTTDTSS